jgi:hypothetical protein
MKHQKRHNRSNICTRHTETDHFQAPKPVTIYVGALSSVSTVSKGLNNLRYLYIQLHTLLTPWCRVLLQKLTGLQLVKKFPAFYGTRRFITALISLRHPSLSWANSTPYLPAGIIGQSTEHQRITALLNKMYFPWSHSPPSEGMV